MAIAVWLAMEVKAGIEDYMERHGDADLREIIGAAVL